MAIVRAQAQKNVEILLLSTKMISIGLPGNIVYSITYYFVSVDSVFVLLTML